MRKAAAGGRNPLTLMPLCFAQPSAQSITLVFEDFLLTYDDDFLFVRDGSDKIQPGDTQARLLLAGCFLAANKHAALCARNRVSAPDLTRAALAQPGAPLAFYTGELPTPMAVRFEASSLRISFRSRGGNRNAGFNITYLADGGCFNGCGSAGKDACKDGLCDCPADSQGALLHALHFRLDCVLTWHAFRC